MTWLDHGSAMRHTCFSSELHNPFGSLLKKILRDTLSHWRLTFCSFATDHTTQQSYQLKSCPVLQMICTEVDDNSEGRWFIIQALVV